METAQNIVTGVNASYEGARATLLQDQLAASPENGREYWLEALDTFEEVGVPQDLLETLGYLRETSRRQDDDEQAANYRERARTIFENAPDPVQPIHED